MQAQGSQHQLVDQNASKSTKISVILDPQNDRFSKSLKPLFAKVKKNDGTYDISAIDFQELQFPPNQTRNNFCGYYIPANQKYYYCSQCCIPSNNLYCKNCFYQQDHQGHYYHSNTCFYEGSAFCDCGRTQRIKKECMCKRHREYYKQVQCQIKQEDRKQFLQCLVTFAQYSIRHGRQQQMQRVFRYLRKFNEKSVYYNRLTYQFLMLTSQSQNAQFAGKRYLNIFKALQQLSLLFVGICSDLKTKKEMLKYFCSEKSPDSTNYQHYSIFQEMGVERQIIVQVAIMSLIDQGFYHPVLYTYSNVKQLSQQNRMKILVQKIDKCTKLSDLTDIQVKHLNQKMALNLLSKIIKIFPSSDTLKKYVVCQQEEIQNPWSKLQLIQDNSLNYQNLPTDVQKSFLLIIDIIDLLQQPQNFRTILPEYQISIQRFEEILQWLILIIGSINKNNQNIDRLKRIFKQVFLIIFNSPNKQYLVKKILNILFSEMTIEDQNKQQSQEVRSLIYYFQKFYFVMAKLLDITFTLIVHRNKISRIQKNKQIQPSQRQLEILERQFKSRLYMLKKLERQNLIDFIQVGFPKSNFIKKILDEISTYNYDQNTFIYKSDKKHTSPVSKLIALNNIKQKSKKQIKESQIKFEQPLYNGEQRCISKQIIQDLVLSTDFILDKVNQQWRRCQEKKSQKKMLGYFYLQFLVVYDGLMEGKNKQVRQILQNLMVDKKSMQQYAKNPEQVSFIQTLLRTEQDQEMLELKRQQSLTQQLKARKIKAQQKKKKIAQKFQKNRLKVLQRSASIKEAQPINEDQICMLCHQKSKEDNKLVILGSLSKNRMFSNINYSNDNKTNTYITTCFHTLHFQCFKKLAKCESISCPLCQKRCLLFLPQLQFSEGESKQNAKMIQLLNNYFIGLMVCQFNVYDPQSLFLLIFKHLVEAKGLNSLLSLQRYRQKREAWRRRDKFLEQLIIQIYRGSKESQRQQYRQQIQGLINHINSCQREELRLIQLLFTQAFRFLVVQGSEDTIEKKLLDLRLKVIPSEFQLIMKQLQCVMDRFYTLPDLTEAEKQTQKKLNQRLQFSMLPLPSRSTECLKLFDKKKCTNCQNKDSLLLCMLCNKIFCSNCRQQHAQKVHSQLQISLFCQNLNMYIRTPRNSKSFSVYYNQIKLAHQELNSYQFFQKDQCQLDNELIMIKLEQFDES